MEKPIQDSAVGILGKGKVRKIGGNKYLTNTYQMDTESRHPCGEEVRS